MNECRVLFLNPAEKRKKEPGEMRCFPLAGFGGLRSPMRNSAEVIDLDEVRAAIKPRRKD